MADLKDTSGAKQGIAVTPDDEAVIEACRALWIGGAGDLTVEFSDRGSPVTITAAHAGYHPLSVRRVLDTGTDATGIVALY